MHANVNIKEVKRGRMTDYFPGQLGASIVGKEKSAEIRKGARWIEN